MSYALYHIRVKGALLFRPLTYTNVVVEEDRASTSVRGGHEDGVDLVCPRFQDPSGEVTGHRGVQLSKSADWPEALGTSGLGLDNDGGDDTFGVGCGLRKGDSNFVNLSSPPKMEDRALQAVFELEGHGGVFELDNELLFQYAMDFEFIEYTSSLESDMTTRLTNSPTIINSAESFNSFDYPATAQPLSDSITQRLHLGSSSTNSLRASANIDPPAATKTPVLQSRSAARDEKEYIQEHSQQGYFSDATGLLRSHKFTCGMSGCGRAYKRRYELQRHQKIHIGVRNHSCRFAACCRSEKGFVRKDHLRQHLRQVHGVSS